ncbi:hypothetical protein ACNKHW_02275 [Shigella flexneri]
MVRLPPAEGAAGQELGKTVINVINKNINESAVVKRIEFVGPSVGAELARPGRWR